jgi:hypothetical protein
LFLLALFLLALFLLALFLLALFLLALFLLALLFLLFFLPLPSPEELLFDFDDDGDESDDESEDDSDDVSDDVSDDESDDDSDDAGLLLPLPLPEGLLLPLPLPEGLLLPLPLPLLAELFFVFPSPAATPPLDEPAGHASLLKPAAARAPVNPRYLFKTRNQYKYAACRLGSGVHTSPPRWKQ